MSKEDCEVGGKTANNTFSDCGHDPADDVHGTVSSRVSEDHEETVLGSLAEGASINSDLDVGILTDEFNTGVQAPDHASHVAEDSLDNGTVTGRFFGLLGEILKDDLNHGNYGD